MKATYQGMTVRHGRYQINHAVEFGVAFENKPGELNYDFMTKCRDYVITTITKDIQKLADEPFRLVFAIRPGGNYNKKITTQNEIIPPATLDLKQALRFLVSFESKYKINPRSHFIDLENDILNWKIIELNDIWKKHPILTYYAISLLRIGTTMPTSYERCYHYLNDLLKETNGNLRIALAHPEDGYMMAHWDKFGKLLKYMIDHHNQLSFEQYISSSVYEKQNPAIMEIYGWYFAGPRDLLSCLLKSYKKLEDPHIFPHLSKEMMFDIAKYFS